MTDNIINDLENVRYHLTASKHKQVIDDVIDLINRLSAEVMAKEMEYGDMVDHEIVLRNVLKMPKPKQSKSLQIW